MADVSIWFAPPLEYHSGHSKRASVKPGMAFRTNCSLSHNRHKRSNAHAISESIPERRDKSILLFGVASVYHPKSSTLVSALYIFDAGAVFLTFIIVSNVGTCTVACLGIISRPIVSCSCSTGLGYCSGHDEWRVVVEVCRECHVPHNSLNIL